MTAPDRTPERVIEEAQKLLGTGESPPGSNCNAITHRFGLGCVAWCDETWWTALFNAGFNDGKGHIDMPGVHTDYDLGDAYVPNTMRHFKAASRFSQTPVPGAGEIHFWGGGEANSHIAIYVKDYGDGTHLNIEGNHNNVCEYVRRPNADSTRMGYCIPAYATTPSPQEEDMKLYVRADGDDRTFEVNSLWLTWVPTDGVLEFDSQGHPKVVVVKKTDAIWFRPEAYIAGDGTVKTKPVSGMTPKA